ncbi:hypothetical protein DSO57_1036811 [Entomophthora muscae]|uniref:Uncharacterized protein n=1 Tax=Entomophthora muscae TaxID=34485 RepID=A0ACC2RQ56_9FUNG|nr:hypothetical protein DSO57_1036811 [Entomophthora muscae]
METPPTPKLTISTPPTSDATGQSSQFLGVLYLALTGLIDSALPAAGTWPVAGKALFYLVKLIPIIWWAMPVPASTPSSTTGALQYSWYLDTNGYFLKKPLFQICCIPNTAYQLSLSKKRLYMAIVHQNQSALW